MAASAPDSIPIHTRFQTQVIRGFRVSASLATIKCDEAGAGRDESAAIGTKRADSGTAAGQVDDLAAELADRFGPPPDEARRLLDFAKLRCRAIDLGIDSITRHPEMIMIGHHDRRAMERLREAAAKKGRVVRVVDQKTVVVPLRAETLAEPNKLLASVRSLLELA